MPLAVSMSAEDPRDPPAPVPPGPGAEPVVEEPGDPPPTREEPGSVEPVPSETPMIA